MSSRLALKSKGLHNYYAFRRLQNEEDLETLTNIKVHTGMAQYVQGKYANLNSAGFLKNHGNARFGFEFLEGLAWRDGISQANKNAFSINGKLHKLGVMHMDTGFDRDATQVRITAVDPRPNTAFCEVTYKKIWSMGADADVMVVKVIE